MPHAVPSASVSMYIPHAGRGMEQVSEIVHCWFSGSSKNSTKLQWTGFFAFISLELAAIGCIQNLFLHLTPSNTYLWCEGPVTLSFPFSIAKKRLHPPSTFWCNAHISDTCISERDWILTFWAWPQISKPCIGFLVTIKKFVYASYNPSHLLHRGGCLYLLPWLLTWAFLQNIGLLPLSNHHLVVLSKRQVYIFMMCLYGSITKTIEAKLHPKCSSLLN